MQTRMCDTQRLACKTCVLPCIDAVVAHLAWPQSGAPTSNHHPFIHSP